MALMVERLIDRAALAYVTGPTLQAALEQAAELEREGVAATIAYWNSRGEDAETVYRADLHALGELERMPPSSASRPRRLSVKAPALQFSRERVSELARRARAAGLELHFDSLAIETQEPIFSLIRDLPDRRGIGCTLPGCWARSERDAELAIELGLRVRLVKGQWKDPQHPRRDARREFLALVDRLAGRARAVSVASHDVPLAARSLERLRARGTAAELELLFGLPMRESRQLAARTGTPVRVYLPYGRGWLPYGLTQLRENPRVLWWIWRDALLGSRARA